MVKLAESQIQVALQMFKNLRATSILIGLDPKAFRVALKYGMMVDDFFAKKQMTPKEDEELTILAQNLLGQTLGSTEQGDKDKPIQEIEAVIWVPMLKALVKSEGRCPCYPEHGNCPCADFIQNYKCKCGLFIVKKLHRY